MILDDPLSALDMHVADSIMKYGLCKELKHKTRIVVTNAIQHLKYAATIFVMDKGRIVFEGTFEEVQENDIYKELKKTTEVKFLLMLECEISGT
jgi:ABC-type multidrug transport system fused ATPase/permease subunit